MKLETENLILYPLTKSLIQQILNDEVTDYSTKEWLTEDNRTLLTWMYEELYAFIPPKIGFTSWIFIEKLTNQVIGDGGYKGNPDTRGQIEIGYEIIESKRQKGYATEAIEALLEWTLTQDEVKSIIAKCHYKNIPSQSLLDKLGFKLIGEEDEMDLYQIKLEENSFFKIFFVQNAGFPGLSFGQFPLPGGSQTPFSKKRLASSAAPITQAVSSSRVSNFFVPVRYL